MSLDALISQVVQDAAKCAVVEVLTKDLPAPEYLDTQAASCYLGLSAKQLELWRANGDGPSFSKLPHLVRYRQSALDSFMAERIAFSTSRKEVRS